MVGFNRVLIAATFCLAGCQEDPSATNANASASASKPTTHSPSVSRQAHFTPMRYPSEPWEEEMVKSVTESFGLVRGSYVLKNQLIRGQVFEASSAPDPNIERYVRLDDGNILFTGCRHHSCPEKAAIVTSPDGTMLAAAIINHRCMFDDLHDELCTENPRLTMFVKNVNDRPSVLRHIEAWAKQVSVDGYDPIAVREKVILGDRFARE